MFEEKAHEYDHQANKVWHAKLRNQTEESEKAPHDNVREESELKGVLRSPADNERMEFVGAVEVVVLKGVDDVESNEPTDDREGEKDRSEMKIAANSQPCAEWSQRKGDAEVDMSEVGETFGERVKANDREGHGRKNKTDEVDEPGDGAECRGAENA